jgi:hypothetical protein
VDANNKFKHILFLIAIIFLGANGSPSEIQEIIPTLRESLKPWLEKSLASVKSVEYTLSLNDQPQKIGAVKGLKNDTGFVWQGITLSTGWEEALSSPGMFEWTFEETTEGIVIKAKKKEGTVAVKCGNGLAAKFGYITTFSDEMILLLNRETRLPISEKHKITEIHYKNWISAGAQQWAPGEIEVFHGDLYFHMFFQWYDQSLWILDHSEYEFQKEHKSSVRIANILLNNPEFIAKAQKEKEEKDRCREIVKNMLEKNKPWISGNLTGLSSLEFIHRTVREDVDEACFIDQKGNVILNLRREGKGNLSQNKGQRKILLANNDYYISYPDEEMATLQFSGAQTEKLPFLLKLRRYAQTGTALNLPLFDYPLFLDSIQLQSLGEKEWKGRNCLVLKSWNTGQSFLNAGTMLGFASWSCVLQERPASETWYIDKERLVPVHETFVSEKEQRTWEIDFRDYREVAPGQWAPFSIEIASGDYFTCIYRFQMLEGKHWMMQDMVSWFTPENKSPGEILDITVNGSSILEKNAMTQIGNAKNILGKNKPPSENIAMPCYPFHIGDRIEVEAPAESPASFQAPEFQSPLQNFCCIREVFFTLDEKGDLTGRCLLFSGDFRTLTPITLNMTLFDDKGNVWAADSLTTDICVGNTLFKKEYILDFGRNEFLDRATHFSVELMKGTPRAVYSDDGSLEILEESTPRGMKYPNTRYMVWDLGEGLSSEDSKLRSASLERMFYYSDIYFEHFLTPPDEWLKQIQQENRSPAMKDIFPNDSRMELIQPLLTYREKTRDEYERTLIALSLGWFQDERVKPVLADSHENSSGMERMAAATGLGILGDPGGWAEIQEALKDDNETLRMNAVWALTVLGDERSMDALSEALFFQKPSKIQKGDNRIEWYNPYERTRWDIIRAFVVLRKPSCIPPLEELDKRSEEYQISGIRDVISLIKKSP